MSDQNEFDTAFQRWAARPPATSAPDAARAVVERLQAEGGRLEAESRREAVGGRRQARRLSPALATLAAAILLLVAGTASFIHSLPSVSPPPAIGNTGRPTTVPARDADVVLWLDDGTPVYVFLPDGD